METVEILGVKANIVKDTTKDDCNICIFINDHYRCEIHPDVIGKGCSNGFHFEKPEEEQ